MKELQAKVNIVPVIGKADCLTKAELLRKKERVNENVWGKCVLIPYMYSIGTKWNFQH